MVESFHQASWRKQSPESLEEYVVADRDVPKTCEEECHAAARLNHSLEEDVTAGEHAETRSTMLPRAYVETRDVSFRFVSFRLVYLPIHIRFVSFSSRIVSFRFDYTRSIGNDWNKKTKRDETRPAPHPPRAVFAVARILDWKPC